MSKIKKEFYNIIYSRFVLARRSAIKKANEFIERYREKLKIMTAFEFEKTTKKIPIKKI